MRLDSRRAMLQGGSRGPAILPGNADGSLLITAVRHAVDDLSMPPETEPLSSESIEQLMRWINRGAVWPADVPLAETVPSERIEALRSEHWSFRPLALLQSQKRTATASGAVDRLIDVGLEAAGLQPSDSASREQLIRRATFDLTGLPPTPQEVDAFVKDDSTDAYAQLIERLLASEAYGERWGRHWLDLVRYADTAGDASDYPVPEAFQYRNYVIDSFNHDLPYDQFIREQLAGDLLTYRDEDERWRQVIATGYLAIAPSNRCESSHKEACDAGGRDRQHGQNVSGAFARLRPLPRS